MIIAKGGSLKKQAYFPIKMTSKALHFFLHAPGTYSVNEALRYGQIAAMGGEEPLVKAILGSSLKQNFENEDFWETVILFFANNPMLDVQHVSPIIDFLQHQKFEYRTVLNERGIAQRLPPPHPDFSIKGRTPSSLLRMTEEWHEVLKKSRKTGNAAWEGEKIEDFTHIEGEGVSEKIYQIRQLLSYKQLLEEGNAMSHCVYSYADSCERKACSIWSVTIETVSTAAPKRLLTIEVNSQHTIVQIRGKCNDLPAIQELDIIRLWAKEARLSLSKWITTRD